MRALVKAKAEPGLWMEDVPHPEIGPDEILIRIQKTSICGTDLHIHAWDDWARETIPVPMIVGHEFMGVVDGMGEAVEGLAIGDRVAGEGHITCGHCRNCRAGRREFCHHHKSVGVSRAGAFAEYLALPAANAFVVPDHVSDEVAAVLDPLGNATHTALAFDVVGEDVLITGAGPIGLMASAIVRHIGGRFVAITDVNDYRLELARAMGVDRVVDVRTTGLDQVMADLGMTEGFDVGLEMSGNEAALGQMLGAMNHGGRVALLGIPAGDVRLDVAEVIFKGLTMRGIYGRRIFETWYKMAAMLQTGLSVEGVITHRFAAEDYEDAFALVASGQSGKVLLEWPLAN